MPKPSAHQPSFPPPQGTSVGPLPVVGQQVVAMSLSEQFWVVFSLLFEPKKKKKTQQSKSKQQQQQKDVTIQCFSVFV